MTTLVLLERCPPFNTLAAALVEEELEPEKVEEDETTEGYEMVEVPENELEAGDVDASF
jgi:hypothetical protein